MKGSLWILLAVGMMAGCARQSDVWRISDSPDGRSRAAVERYSSLANWIHLRPRVELVTPAGRTFLYPHELNPAWDFRVDYPFQFAELAWSSDSKVIAVLVVGPPIKHPLQRIWFAYDVERQRVVDPSVMIKPMQDTIRANYGEHENPSDRDRRRITAPTWADRLALDLLRGRYAEEARLLESDPFAWTATDDARHVFIARLYKPGTDLSTPRYAPEPLRPFWTGSDGRQR